jgi:hypothetical protein
MRPIETVLLEYVRGKQLPAWIVLLLMEAQGYSEFESLIALLLHVQAGHIVVDTRGRISTVIPSEEAPHEA